MLNKIHRLTYLSILIFFSFVSCALEKKEIKLNQSNSLASKNTIEISQYPRLQVIKDYLDNVLEKSKDSKNNSPLLASAINIETGEPLIWVFPDGHTAILSNFSAQQNFLRTLVAFSDLTGDSYYKNKASEMTQFYFDNFQHENGLLYWGGHRFIDLETLDIEGPSEKEMVHELKNAYPYYDLFFELDQKNSKKFIEGFWNAHVYNWGTLETSRHGNYEAIPPDNVWIREKFIQQEPFFSTKGLSFLNAGNDLIYSALKYYLQTGNKGALAWGKLLTYQYVNARDPKTKLGVYQFSQPLKREEPKDDKNTHSKYGDRAQRQFGPEFGEKALEGNMLLKGRTETIYSENALMQLQMAQELGEEGKDLLNWTLEGMEAFAAYAYEEETNTFKPLLADGSDLSYYKLPRDGYYGKKGTTLKPYKADSTFMLSYARAYLISKNPNFWNIIKGIAKDQKLGDFGNPSGKNLDINLKTGNRNPLILLAILDIYKSTGNQEYLKLAERIADNIIKRNYIDGWFLEEENLQYANIDNITPYAILSLEALNLNNPKATPAFLNGSGYTEGSYLLEDGNIRISTRDVELFSLKKGETLQPNGKVNPE